MTTALDQARDLFQEGLGHFGAGRLAQAEGCFAAALALVPGRPSLLTNLGVTRVRLGQPAAAVPLLEQATAAEPKNLEAWAHLALAHAALEQPAQALVCCNKAIAIDPSRASLWLQRAQLLVRQNRSDEALDALDRALAIDTTLADAWSHKGTLLREMQRLPEAAACFEKAIAHGADADVHRYFLAAVHGGNAPANAPLQYVQYLFDDYAHEFQSHLVDLLGYQGHSTLVAQLARLSQRRFASALDLGCGTGLCGPLVKPMVDRLDGLDLSAAMLAKARALGVYSELIQADAVSWLRNCDRCDDLVLAADVFIYIGELGGVFAGVARILRPGGVFCFTVESWAGTGDMQLLPSLRYAHSEAYLRRLADQHGLAVLGTMAGPLRKDQQRPVQGLYVYLVRA